MCLSPGMDLEALRDKAAWRRRLAKGRAARLDFWHTDASSPRAHREAAWRSRHDLNKQARMRPPAWQHQSKRSGRRMNVNESDPIFTPCSSMRLFSKTGTSIEEHLLGEVGIQTYAPRHVPENVMTADAGVQCCPDDMLERMHGLRVYHARLVERVMEGPQPHDAATQYNASSHFSLFEEPERVVALSVGLAQAELTDLADSFLGTRIGGTVLKERSLSYRPWHLVPIAGTRIVPERFVTEAMLLNQSHAGFHSALLASAHRVLLTGSEARPYHGESLLRLACRYPRVWSAPALTALDITARLIRAQVLPSALLAPLLMATFKEAASEEAHANTVVLALVALALQVALPSQDSPLRRTRSAPAASATAMSEHRFEHTLEHFSQPVLARATSTPAPRGDLSRSVGVSLRPQDRGEDGCSFSCISIAPKSMHEVRYIPSAAWTCNMLWTPTQSERGCENRRKRCTW